MAIKYNFTLDKGTDHTFFMEFQNMDGSRMNLRSFLIQMHVKQGAYGNKLDELTTTNGRLIASSTEDDVIVEYCQTLKRKDLFGINSDLFPVTY